MIRWHSARSAHSVRTLFEFRPKHTETKPDSEAIVIRPKTTEPNQALPMGLGLSEASEAYLRHSIRLVRSRAKHSFANKLPFRDEDCFVFWRSRRPRSTCFAVTKSEKRSLASCLRFPESNWLRSVATFRPAESTAHCDERPSKH